MEGSVKLERLLAEYARTGRYAFHMPGHKRQPIPGCGWLPLAEDITEIAGFDNLHAPEGILKEEMAAAASLFGAESTFFSVNGSTGAVLAAVSAAVPKGGTLLLERGSHISVYHAAELRDLRLVFIRNGLPYAEQIRKAQADAVILTSPSYEGCMKDVRGWAEAAHACGIPLLADEAHGAHLMTDPYFPESAVTSGADLVVQSLHKTLPAMTQTALLHNVTGRIGDDALRHFLDVYETSSPSYVLMASVTACLHFLQEEGKEAFSSYINRLRHLREELSGLTQLHLAGGAEGILTSDSELPPYRKGTRLDPGKLVITAKGRGALLDRLLRERYHLEMEMKAPDYVLAMTSVFDTEEGFARLLSALRELDADGRFAEDCPDAAGAGGDAMRQLYEGPWPEAYMSVSEAVERKHVRLPLSEAAGRVSGGYLCLYPPDLPLILPGEVISPEIAKSVREYQKNGFTVTGVVDEFVEIVYY